jgi:hypothetical protein
VSSKRGAQAWQLNREVEKISLNSDTG